MIRAIGDWFLGFSCILLGLFAFVKIVQLVNWLVRDMTSKQVDGLLGLIFIFCILIIPSAILGYAIRSNIQKRWFKK